MPKKRLSTKLSSRPNPGTTKAGNPIRLRQCVPSDRKPGYSLCGEELPKRPVRDGEPCYYCNLVIDQMLEGRKKNPASRSRGQTQIFHSHQKFQIGDKVYVAGLGKARFPGVVTFVVRESDRSPLKYKVQDLTLEKGSGVKIWNESSLRRDRKKNPTNSRKVRAGNPVPLKKLHYSPLFTNASINRTRAAEAYSAGMTPQQIAKEWPLVWSCNAEGKLGQKYDSEIADGSGRLETSYQITRQSVDDAVLRLLGKKLKRDKLGYVVEKKKAAKPRTATGKWKVLEMGLHLAALPPSEWSPLQRAFEELRPEVEQMLRQGVHQQFEALRTMQGPTLHSDVNLRSGEKIPIASRQYYSIKQWRESLPDVFEGEKPIQYDTKSVKVVDAAKLERYVKDEATKSLYNWYGKITGKVGRLTRVKSSVKGAIGGRGEYIIQGEDVAGREVVISQQLVHKVSSRGTHFVQAPARIYIDRKFFSEEDYKRARAAEGAPVERVIPPPKPPRMVNLPPTKEQKKERTAVLRQLEEILRESHEGIATVDGLRARFYIGGSLLSSQIWPVRGTAEDAKATVQKHIQSRLTPQLQEALSSLNFQVDKHGFLGVHLHIKKLAGLQVTAQEAKQAKIDQQAMRLQKKRPS